MADATNVPLYNRHGEIIMVLPLVDMNVDAILLPVEGGKPRVFRFRNAQGKDRLWGYIEVDPDCVMIMPNGDFSVFSESSDGQNT